MMTVGEMRELIEGLDDSVEVRLAMQPRWAFEYSIGNAVIVGPASLPPGHEPEEDEDVQPEENVVYLAEGSQLGYLPGYVSREIGWRG
ncbi:glycosyltransferase family 1 protein [Paraburkholderia sp. Tr-20389]|uniref:hypothetical protein n=1 Tax=Paraburkholderia sp. Tr-20389 TaxID=2703903 RepID=UPI0019813FFB|nr:hypothetical protein [Paraburkholderia sp. Tr-20389]MBN3756094.1 glycosyltransferase family 1 protein [Paraburkholderia sp. Tr-20389]